MAHLQLNTPTYDAVGRSEHTRVHLANMRAQGTFPETAEVIEFVCFAKLDAIVFLQDRVYLGTAHIDLL